MFFDLLPGAGYVCAHRGARALTPENTMLAFERGLARGADYWETDVHKTADGSLVLFHDDTLGRTSDVRRHAEFADREPWATTSFTLDELRRLDIGSWFIEKDPFGTIAAGDVGREDLERMSAQRVPTLREALEFTRRNNFPMNLEIKDQINAPGDLSIVGDVLRELRESGAEELVLVSSFNHDYLIELHRLAPAIPLAALVEEEHPADTITYLKALGCAAYHPDESMLDADLVSRLTEEGIKVAPYTVNDMDRALALLDAGCFGIITDYTHSLRALLSEQKG